MPVVEEKKKKKSLRNYFSLPISGILYNMPQISGNDEGINGGSSEGINDDGVSDGVNNGVSDGVIKEMIGIVNHLQKGFTENKKPYEVYDVEESAPVIPHSTGEFQPNMNDKEVGSFPENPVNEKKYTVHVKNSDSGKIVQIPHAPIVMDEVKTEEKKEPMSVEKNPRHWAAKYWAKKPIKKLISEIINPDDVDVSLLKFHDKLNPEIWDGEDLKEDVRKVLMKVAIAFIKSCKLEKYKYKDIVLVGSMANYSYTPVSDIDIHILMDFNQLKVADEALLGEYFDAKKDLWSINHEIRIGTHPIECYIQNANEPYTSIGVFSILNDEWVKHPLKKMVSVDEADVQLKAARYMNAIDKLESRFNKGEDVTAEFKKVKDKIKNMRVAGLHKEGEYSIENLVFKILRNSGYLEKLLNLKNHSIDKEIVK